VAAAAAEVQEAPEQRSPFALLMGLRESSIAEVYVQGRRVSAG
jgi:hypothetical protein